MRYGLGLLAAIALMTFGRAEADPQTGPMKLALAYDGRLYLKVLDIQFDQTIDAGAFSSSVKMRSYGVLALFKRFDIRAASQGRVRGGQAQPGAFDYLNRDGERVRRVKVAWTDDDVAMTSSPPFGNLGQPPASRDQKLGSADPLTQLIRVAMMEGPSGACGATQQFFDGKQLYALAFGAPRSVNLTTEQQAIGLTAPVACTVRYEEIAGFKAKSAAKRNQGLNGPIEVVMSRLGAGGPWVLASMSADTPLGKARIVLHRATLTR